MKPDGTRHTLDDLRAMTSVTISNALAAEVLEADPGRMAEYGREGKLPWPTVPSGNRVKHGREEFIRFWGGDKA